MRNNRGSGRNPRRHAKVDELIGSPPSSRISSSPSLYPEASAGPGFLVAPADVLCGRRRPGPPLPCRSVAAAVLLCSVATAGPALRRAAAVSCGRRRPGRPRRHRSALRLRVVSRGGCKAGAAALTVDTDEAVYARALRAAAEFSSAYLYWYAHPEI